MTNSIVSDKRIIHISAEHDTHLSIIIYTIIFYSYAITVQRTNDPYGTIIVLRCYELSCHEYLCEGQDRNEYYHEYDYFATIPPTPFE